MPQLIWLVTGCSSGFGKAFIPAILARGDRIVAATRTPESLASLEGADTAIVKLDVSASPEAIREAVEIAIGKFGHIDVLVNNAGFAQGGVMEEFTNETFLEVYKTNFLGPFNVTKAIAPHFRQRRSGTIVCISSEAGIKGEVAAAGYSAAKSALEGAFEVFHQETAAFGIKTLIIQPGSFRTGLLGPPNIRIQPSTIADYEPLFTAVVDGVGAISGNQPGDPDKAVERIIDVIRGEGLAKGKSIPFRLPLGPDALQKARQRGTETLGICDEWEELISSTNFDATV